MPRRSARRLGVLSTTILLAVGLLAPSVASAAPAGAAATFGQRGSAFTDTEVRASSATPIKVRDLSFSCPSGRVPKGGFQDVPSSYDFARTIDCLVWYEITQGKTETTYAPTDSVSRRQMAVFIHRLLDDLVVLPDPPSSSQFRDVPATGEAGEAINTLASKELADLLGVQIVAGKSATHFEPGGKVTRAQMGSFVARTLEGVFHATGVTITDRGRCDNVFNDEASIPNTHVANVKLLCAAGVVTGRTDGSYGPAADVNRGQMSAFLMRLMDIFVEVEVTVPPDAFAQVHVDRGSAETCDPSGRDGSLNAPFCTIQAGIDAAGAIDGFVVDVLVHRQQDWYSENVVLRSNDAFEVHLLNADDPAGPLTNENAVFLDGSVRISGSTVRDVNALAGIAVFSEVGSPAITIDTPGSAVILGSAAVGEPSAIVANQTGRTAVFDSVLAADEVAIDLVATRLATDGTGTVVSGNTFDSLFTEDGAFVMAPAGASHADANLTQWRGDNVFLGHGSGDDGVPTEVVTRDGRRAIVEAR